MALVTLPNELEPNTPATAGDVMGNFNALVDAVNGNLEAVNLADASVAAGQLAADAVTTTKIADAAVTVAKMASNSVDSPQYVDGSIDKIHLADDSVGTTKLENLAVTNAKMAADSVDSVNYVDGSVDTVHTSFLAQMPSDAVLMWGRVSGLDGGIIDTDNFPAGWGGSKLSTGLYRITHPGSATQAPLAIPTTTSATPRSYYASVRQVDAGQFDIGIFDETGTPVDSTYILWVGFRG